MTLSDTARPHPEPPPGPDRASAGPAPTVGPVVALTDVSRRFGTVQALDGLSMEVPSGRITVLLGPNGAGKTTAIRAITGAMTPDYGTVRTFGLDPERHGEEIRRRCGVVSAKPALYDRLTGWENLQYSAELYGLGSDAREPIIAAATRFGIQNALDNQVGGYSTGMKTRLALARSMLHEPDLLLYDEPTSGLDPESSHAVLELIREMTAEGRTVVMCTHLLVEAEGLADQIVVLESGTDLLAGTQAGLTRRFWPDDIVYLDAETPSDLDRIESLPGVLGRREVGTTSGQRTEVRLDSLERIPDLVTRLAAEGVRLTRVEPHQPTLEDLYFAVRAERKGQETGPPGPGGPTPTRSRLDAQEGDVR